MQQLNTAGIWYGLNMYFVIYGCEPPRRDRVQQEKRK